MKSNRGVTLISLMVYIIVLSVVIGMMSLFTKYFYQNVDDTVITNNASEQHSRFLEYFANDVNSNKIDIEKLSDVNSTDNNKITLPLLNGVTHVYIHKNDKKIYYQEFNKLDEQTKNILLCDNVENCNFTYDTETKKVTITMKLSGNMVRTNTFTIK